MRPIDLIVALSLINGICFVAALTGVTAAGPAVTWVLAATTFIGWGYVIVHRVQRRRPPTPVAQHRP